MVGIDTLNFPFFLYFSSLILLILIFFSIFRFRILISPFRRISMKTWIYASLIVISGFVIRFFITPHIILRDHLHGYDVLSLGYNMFYENLFTYFYFAYYSFQIFGHTPEVMFNVNALFGSLSVILIFFLSYLIFHKEKTALFSALLFCLYPLHIKLSGGDVLIITGLFFSILSLIFLHIYIRKNDHSILILSLLALYFAVMSRLEMSFFPLIFFLYFIVFKKKPIKSFFNLKTSGSAILFVMIMLPYTFSLLKMHLFYSLSRNESPQLIINALFTGMPHWFVLSGLNAFVNIDFTPPLFILFFIFGIIIMLFFKRKLFFMLFFWIMLFFYLHTPSSVVDNITYLHGNARFNLQFIVPLVLISSFGIDHLCGYLSSFFKKFRSKRANSLSGIIIVSLIVVSAAGYYDYLYDFQYNPQNEYMFIQDSLEHIPPNSNIYDFSSDTGGKSSVLFSYSGKNLHVKKISELEDMSDFPPSSYFYLGLICFREPTYPAHINEGCADVIERYNLVPIFNRSYPNTPYSRCHDIFIDVDELEFGVYGVP
jgi:dolichyl-phosphate-mannose-protein mannosyltransferase